jgi:GNAT superfamily N-acetyltransferase
MDVRTMLSRDKNPFFRHAEAEYFLAERPADGRAGGRADGRPGDATVRRSARPTFRRDGERWEVVGRIAAVHNRAHNEFQRDQVGFFGFFDSIDDADVAGKLFDAAAAWLKPRGIEIMRGPASFSTNDECGLVVDGFERRPTILTPYNPPYYVRLVEQAGFTTSKNLLMYQTVSATLPDRLKRAAEKVRDRLNIRLRPLDKKRFTDEVERIKPLYNGAWENNWGFVPLTDAEIEHLAKQLKPVVVPDLVVFAERNGDPIGFAAAVPDFNVALKTNPSGRIFPGIVPILLKSRSITRIRILLLGVLKEYRGMGVAELMYHWIWEKAVARGYDWGEAGWVLEDNAPMNRGLEFMGFEVYRKLRFYDRPL